MNLKVILFLLFCLLSFFHFAWNKKVSNSISEIRDFIFIPKLHESLLSMLILFGCLSVLLSNFFWIILAAQVVALLIAYLISVVLKALSGLDNYDKKDKIFSIAVWTVFKVSNSGVGWLAFMKFAKVFFKISMLVAIVLFWIYPIESIQKNTLVIILYYLIPAFTGAVVLLSTRARMMLFNEVDDDSRSHFVIQSSLITLYLFAMLSIPLLLISQLPQFFSLSTSVVWVLFFIPFALFVFFVSGPYFVGQKRHLHYLKTLSENYRILLVETQKALYLPNLADQKARLVSLKSEVLKEPLLSYAEHHFIEFNVLLEIDPRDKKALLYIRDKLSDKKNMMEQWDCSFYYYRKTCELISYFDLKDFSSMEQYLKASIDEAKYLINKDVSKRTVIGIILFAIVSGFFAYLFKVFEPILLEAFGKLR